jgi:DNA-binding transcriptional ArsR family regulator
MYGGKVTIDCTEFCRALADDTRQRILVLLADREMCVTEIVDAFKIAQPTVSHHLNVLRQNGLLNRRKDGKQVYYSLNHGNVVSCCGRLMAKFDAAADCRTP